MTFPKITRRKVIKNGLTAAAAFSIVPRHVLGGAGYSAPSDANTRGIIGWGGQARAHPGYNDAKILAVSDVDADHLSGAPGGATRYPDWRDVIARDDIDFVHIVTPTHWHGLQVIAAAQAGKDIWCEKPFVRTIGESLRAVEACHCNGTILRINTWGRTGGQYDSPTGMDSWEIKKLLDSGLMTPPYTVNFNMKFNHNFKQTDARKLGKINPDLASVPRELDYDMWLGPRPWKPYTTHRLHNSWRAYWDYSSGGLGDMAFHYFDPMQWAMGKDNESPVKITVDTDSQHPEAVEQWRRIELIYADGTKMVCDQRRNGSYSADGEEDNFIEDSAGNWLRKGHDSNISNLQSKMADMPDVDRGNTDFMECMRTREKFALNEDVAHRTCTLINLASIAVYLGRDLDFDPDKMAFIGDEQANRLIDPPMRAPWNLETGGM